MGKRRNEFGVGDVARIAGGIVLGYFSVSGIRNAIGSFQKGNTASIIVTVMAIPISILFLLIAFTMIAVSLPAIKKKRRKRPPQPAPSPPDEKEKKQG